MKMNSNSPMKREQRWKRAKSHRPVQREMKEVLADLVEKLRGKLEPKAASASPAEARPRHQVEAVVVSFALSPPSFRIGRTTLVAR